MKTRKDEPISGGAATVWDAEKAALDEDYKVTIAWAVQTALHEVIGQMDLANVLIGRARMDDDLQKIIYERTTPRGVTVQSVEIRDVVIPQDLEDTMNLGGLSGIVSVAQQKLPEE